MSMREEPELSISKKQADCAIRAVGFLGLVVMFFSLQSATVRPAGTRLSLSTGFTPLIGVELARSKADLEQFFGEPGSANRNLIAGRSAMPGVDFFSGWILFLFGLGELMPAFRPRMRAARFDIFVLLCFTAFFEYHTIAGMAQVAGGSPVTDAFFSRIRETSLIKWGLLFFNTMKCSSIFLRTPLLLRAGGAILCASSALGIVAIAYPDYQWLAGPAVLGLFVGLCGITVLFLVQPGLFYAETKGKTA